MRDGIPRTTSRTEVGSAKASRMNSCGIFGSATFSMLARFRNGRWGGAPVIVGQGSEADRLLLVRLWTKGAPGLVVDVSRG